MSKILTADLSVVFVSLFGVYSDSIADVDEDPRKFRDCVQRSAEAAAASRVSAG